VFDLVDNAQTGNQSFAFRYQEDNATVYVDTVPVSGSMASFMIYPINTVRASEMGIIRALIFDCLGPVTSSKFG
jgi:hypothetical protein